MDTPIPEAYWVEPGLLLAGPYPGARRASAEPRLLRQLLDGGVEYFLDLTEQDEAPPYTAWLGDRACHVRLPIPDFGVPTVDAMIRILDKLDCAVQQKRCGYVHCMGGRGRTGTVVGCYLVRHGIAGDAALARIAQLRANTPSAHSPSPETDAQRQMILHWKAGQ